jgi:hypothetical protein
MSLAELLTSQRRWGRTRARKFLLSLALSENKRLGTLTHRQRLMLANELSAKTGERYALAVLTDQPRRPPILKDSPPEARRKALRSATTAATKTTAPAIRQTSRTSPASSRAPRP